MHQGEDQDQDQQPEDWLGAYEEDDIDELQQEPNLEEKLLSEKDLAEQHLFLTFQNSATAIAQLYKGIFNQICMIFLITEWVVFFVLLLTVVAKLGEEIATNHMEIWDESPPGSRVKMQIMNLVY